MNNTSFAQVKVSIVMPVHNTGEYLRDTLESIFMQSFQDFELICVDDASDDVQTINILREYESLHKNMQVIHIEQNIKAGEARNIGFTKTEGEYVIFLDSDDVFQKNFLLYMYQKICKNNADVCVCGYEEFYIENGTRYGGVKWIPDEYKMSRNKSEEWLLNISMAAWNKLCRTEFLKTHKIHFQSLTSCNDVYFSCRVMINALKICYVAEEPLVYYRTNNEKQISASRNPLDLYKAMTLLYKAEEKDINNNLLPYWIGALLLKNGIGELQKCNNEVYKKQYYDLLQKYFTDHNIDFRNRLLHVCVGKVRELSYESRWFHECMDYLEQFRFVAKYLIEDICRDKPVFLWGLGCRGNAFQQFCSEQNIQLQGVADIKNCNVGEVSDYGNKIVNTEYVLQSGGLVIASNEMIYSHLLGSGVDLINLEEYCFL